MLLFFCSTWRHRCSSSLAVLFSLSPVTEPEENTLKDILRVEVELLGQGADSAAGRGVSRYLDAFHDVTEVTVCL